jgi:hypothetical protein
MVAIVSVETVLLVLLVVLVAALLRSHAEILRRLGPEGSSGRESAPVAEPRSGVRADAPAPELAGVTPGGDAVKLAFDGLAAGSTLLAFLSTGCTSCARFWEDLDPARPRQLPAGLQTVIVTRGAEREQRSKLRSLAPEGVPVVMSSQAWAQYAVPGSPYFVLVEDGAVRGEGVATTWQALSSLVQDAIEEQAELRGSDNRHRRIDETLTAAGIGPDHPSLYPGRERAGREAPD